MQSENGSFTIEASIICTIIVVVTVNALIIVLNIYDIGIINRRIEYQMFKVEAMDTNINKAEDSIRESLEGKLFCLEVIDIECESIGKDVEIIVKSRYKMRFVGMISGFVYGNKISVIKRDWRLNV